MRIESLILIGVITIIFLFINYNMIRDKSKREKIQKKIFISYSIEKHREIRDRLLQIDYPALGISGQGVLDEINNILAETPEEEEEKDEETLQCLVYPDSSGHCLNGTLKDDETGCCELPDEKKPTKFQKGSEITQDILLGMILEELAMGILIRLPILLRKLANVGLRMTSKIVALASKRLAQSISRAAVKIGGKIATKGFLKSLASVSLAGPAAFALLGVELIAVFGDITDASGYGSYTESGAIDKMRDVLDFQMQKSTQQPSAGEESRMWPCLMPIGLLYEDEFGKAYEETIADYFTGTIQMILSDENNSFGDTIVGSLLSTAFNSQNEFVEQYEIPEDQTEILMNEVEKLMMGDDTLSQEENNLRIQTRDLTLFTKLSKLVDDPTKIALYPEFSTRSQFGISLSQQAVEDWNEQNYDNYLKQNPRNMPVVPKPQIACYYGKEYRSLNISNPGTTENPNMVKKNLNNSAPLCGMYGILAYLCAGDKASQGLFELSANPNSSQFPRKYGVKFDFNNMQCRYTNGYCQRMGLDFNSNTEECRMRPGQQGAETIFGESLVRGPIRSWENGSSFIENNLGIDGEIGMGVFLAAAATGPFGLAVAAAFVLGPLIVDLTKTIAGNFKDKKIPEQIENTVIYERINLNNQIKNDEFKFLYDSDRNKYFISEPINFSV